MKFRKPLKTAARAIPFLLIIAIVFTVSFFPKPKTEAETQKRIVRVWNVDTFEGGKGSRTAFLRRVAQQVQKDNEGVYYMITAYTAEGAYAAFEAGNAPDILSYGIGLSAYAEQCLPLPYSFAGGETNIGCLAYPWCGGKYYLFSMDETFDDEGATAISKGGNNLPEVAANLAGIKGEIVESNAAYVGFLSGKYRYLLGTQRDECRFSLRGVSVYSKPLDEYCDLFQYISILSANRRADCEIFLKTLLSEETQERLSEIGMKTVNNTNVNKTVSVFADRAALDNLAQTASSGGDVKILDKFLKTI